MAKFSGTSLNNFATLHRDLQIILEEAITLIDFAIICGHRSEIDQAKAFLSGKSKLKWPNSRHNSWPSEAADLVPFPVSWDDEEGFRHIAEVIRAIGAQYKIQITWGGDWPMRDLVHFELTRPRQS